MKDLSKLWGHLSSRCSEKVIRVIPICMSSDWPIYSWSLLQSLWLRWWDRTRLQVRKMIGQFASICFNRVFCRNVFFYSDIQLSIQFDAIVFLYQRYSGVDWRIFQWTIEKKTYTNNDEALFIHNQTKTFTTKNSFFSLDIILFIHCSFAVKTWLKNKCEVGIINRFKVPRLVRVN